MENGSVRGGVDKLQVYLQIETSITNNSPYNRLHLIGHLEMETVRKLKGVKNLIETSSGSTVHRGQVKCNSHSINQQISQPYGMIILRHSFIVVSSKLRTTFGTSVES